MSLFKNQTRLAMAYTNKVGDKVYPVVVDIKKGIKSTEDIQFVSSDVNTGILSVAFIQGNDNYNVTGADVVCSVMRPDASTLELPCEVVGENIVEVPLGINGTSQDGVYSFDFKVFKGENKVVGTPIMNYSVSLSIDNDIVVEEDDRLPVLTVLMTQLTELKGEARESINQANTATVASRGATAKAIEATNNANAVSERVSQETSEAISRVDNKVNEVETRFNALTTSQQQDAEVIDARDGEVSLKARLDRDLYKDGMSLSDRIEAIEGLKDSQNMKYETDKGYLVCKETKNGVIDDLKIEGKTLVNVLRLGGNWFEQETTLQTDSTNTIGLSSYPNSLDLSLLKNNTVYTVIPFVDYTVIKKGMIYVQLNTEINGTDYGLFRITEDMFNKPTLITTSELTNKNSKSLFIGGANCEYRFKNVKILVLEGDHTQNPPSYFEGLMSVGQDVDKIEVLSVNENLVPNDWDYKFQCFGDMKVNQIDTRTFEIVNTNTVDGIVISKNFINKFCYNNKVVFDFYSNQRGVFYVLDYGVSGESYKPVQGAMVIEDGRNVFVVDVSNASGRLAFRFNNNTKNSTMIISDFSIKTSENSNNVNHQSDKKQILFYNSNGELEPVTELHEWDSIEKHSDNKWYYHKRSGKVVLNGSEEFYLVRTTDNTIVFGTDLSKVSINNLKMILSDKFNFIGDDIFEQIRIGNSGRSIFISILKSKLPTQDVEGFKQWLQANNVTAVYQLAQEEVYELAPLHLDSYANETLILCNSGAISPKMEFSITSHINELVKSQGDRISLLEEKMYKALKQVLAGDMYSLAELLYPEDFVEENPENEIMLLPFE